MASLAEPTPALLSFTRTANPAPRSAEARAAVLADPGFGTQFTDHMVTIDWTAEAGWHDAAVVPYGPIPLDPAASVLHYAQEIFEGLKAYRHPDGSLALFRPEANAARLNTSAQRLAMTMNLYALAGRTPRNASVAIMNGRKYSEPPSTVGNQAASAATSSRTAAMNTSGGSSGIASRCADVFSRAALASGRNSASEPSGWR